ncbi:MAG: transcription factor TFIIIC subunit tfc4 [Thelocarpon superellum]|nr:MAG: transcription factor TFIIIC subunit tfc4 [Thelocarpon superellum]
MDQQVDHESADDGDAHTYPELDHQPSYPWLGGNPQGQAMRRGTYVESPSLNSEQTSDRYGSRSREEGEGRRSHHVQLSDDGIPSSEEADEDSDEDREFFTLQSDVASFQQKLKSRGRGRQESPPRGAKSIYGNRGGRRGPRGPRKPVEPPMEIKLLLAQANGAFVNGEYERAEELANQVLLMNDETYAAHALLSGIYLEQGEIRLGIIAFLSAAHLRPKDPSLWRSCAHLILEHGRENRAEYLKDAIYCFTQLIRINAKDVESRYERALLVRELGLKGRAANELYQIHDMLPRDTTVLRLLAEISIDNNDVDRATQLYRSYFSDMLVNSPQSGDVFDWSDVNVFVELMGYQEEYADGIAELKMLSRYLLGREDETYWDDIDQDDREWDAEDHPRRAVVPGFTPGRFEQASYGAGLPLELRVKMGAYRLNLGHEHLSEALGHFAWLDVENDEPGAKLYDYPDLFRETADALQVTGHHHEALKFLEPLQQIDGYPDAQLYLQMATSYRGIDLPEKSELCYKTVIEHDERNIEARVHLARLYEELDMPEEAFTLANEVLQLTQQDGDTPDTRSRAGHRAGARTGALLPTASKASQRTPRKPRMTAEETEEREAARVEAMQMQHAQVQSLQDQMRAGDESATIDWMRGSKVLVQEFRSARVFFPWDKYVRFLGYSREARKRALKSKGNETVTDMEAMADRLKASLEDAGKAEDPAASAVPDDYRGIPFDQWLDVFLEYALCLAKRGQAADAYEVLGAAYDANVFYHSPESVFQIQLCWAVCALAVNDDETICNVARWFMKEHQFTTDTYRLYAALHRCCKCPMSWYNAGPSQKYVLRQIKAMDFSLVSEEYRKKHFGEKASYTSKDEHGNPIVNDEMDVALLTLYGHMLYVGTSYANAFNYYFRAYQLDRGNPMTNLFLGLNFLHYSLKRQSENRHYLIMQGLNFLFAYYDIRQTSSLVGERQEADYNIARSFHMIGLMHLAVSYYERVLTLADETCSSGAGTTVEHFARDAAYNLQLIYLTAGNLEMAKSVTERYLVI